MQAMQASHMTVPKVAHLVIALDHGGLERCAVLWTHARNTRRPGSTRLICLDRAGPLAAQLQADAVHVLSAERARLPWDLRAVRDLRRLLGKHAIDIVHSHNTAARFYAALAVRGSGVKHLYTDHGTNPHLHGWRARLRLRFMDRHTDTRIAVSATAAGALKPSVAVIPNGIVPDATGDRSLRHQLALPADAYLIGCVGRLAPEKGIDRLLTAFASLPPDCRLVILGDGPDRRALQDQAKALRCADRIHMPGPLDSARACMPAFDLLVLPSRSEGLPLTLLEAMAEGVPVAATRVGQCPTVLDDGKLGLLLPDDDAAWPALLSAELEAIRAGRRDATRVAAQRRIAEAYSLDRTLDAYETRYRELVAAS